MSMRVTALLIFILLPCFSASASESTHEPETYSKLRVSVGGYYYSGNLNQLQGNFQGHYGLSSPTAGLDFLFNGYRLWAKANKEADYKVTGDDLYGTGLPFWYFHKRFYLAGLGRYESSKSQQLKSRYMGGLGLGYTPTRSKNFLVRFSIIPAFERADFESSDFRISVPHEGTKRSVIRVAALSNGWYKIPDSPVTLRYFAQLWPNPETPEDFRLNITFNMDVKLVKSLSFRTSVFAAHDAAGPEGREPTDIRSTFGFSWSTD